MTIEVRKNLQEYIEQKVASGMYATKDELINEALTLHLEEDKKNTTLEDVLQKGLDDIQHNRVERFTSKTVDEILDKVLSKKRL